MNATEPLDSAWLDRLAQFIDDASQHGLYTLVTMVYAPSNAYFRNITNKIPQLGRRVEWRISGWMEHEFPDGPRAQGLRNLRLAASGWSEISAGSGYAARGADLVAERILPPR